MRIFIQKSRNPKSSSLFPVPPSSPLLFLRPDLKLPPPSALLRTLLAKRWLRQYFALCTQLSPRPPTPLHLPPPYAPRVPIQAPPREFLPHKCSPSATPTSFPYGPVQLFPPHTASPTFLLHPRPSWYSFQNRCSSSPTFPTFR